MDIEEYAQKVHFHVDEVPPLLLEQVRTRPWKSLLDLGCGDGALLFSLRQRGLLQGRKVWAVDLSETRVRRVQAMDTGFECHVAGASEVPMIRDGSVDLLVSTQVIEHVPDPDGMLREMRRVLAPGGRVYLSTVFKEWYGWYFYRCNGRWTLDPTHLREYGRDEELLDPVRQVGFRVLEERKTPLAFPLLDFVLRRVASADRVRTLYRWSLLRSARRLKVPIVGYSNWELVLGKD